MFKLLLITFLVVSILLIILIILQPGEGVYINNSIRNFNDYSNNLFSLNNSNIIMTRLITLLAIMFFVLSLFLVNLSNNNSSIKKRNTSCDTKSNTLDCVNGFDNSIPTE